MSDLFEMNFEDDLEQAKAAPDSERWALEKIGGQAVLASVFPISKPEDVYLSRLVWTRYPNDLASLKFIDRETGRDDLVRAWPMVRGFRPSTFDTCVSWTAEGHKLHPEWAADARFRHDPRGNVLLKTLRILVSELDDHFTGRAA
jgi:hypothetical protein